MKSFDQIENQIKAVFEKSSEFFSWSDQSELLVHQLCESIKNYLLTENPGEEQIPSGFNIYMNPEDAQLWKKQESWQKNLSSVFIEILAEFGYKNVKNFDFFISTRNSLLPGDISIQPISRTIQQGQTDSINHSDSIDFTDEQEEINTYPTLLFRDNELIPIKKTVVNIGRRNTNDIVINDLRISRVHAQIRKSREGLMIFDVGSSGGTFINGERKMHHLLRSGDVISLAGYTMIFTNENEKSGETDRARTSELSKKTEE